MKTNSKGILISLAVLIIAKIKALGTSVLMAFATATLVLVVGGFFAYQIYKFARRVNGPPNAPQPTNESQTFVPSGATNVVSVSWQNPRIWFEWVNTSTLNGSNPSQGLPGLIGFSLLSTNNAVSNEVARPVVYATLNETGRVIIALLWEKDTNLKPVSFQDLGMPVDEAGVPDLSWSVGQLPTDAGVLAGLERSTNLVDWTPVIEWRVRSGFTNTFRDNVSSPNAFYRSVPR